MSHNPAAENHRFTPTTEKNDEWTNTVGFDATRNVEKLLEEDLKMS